VTVRGHKNGPVFLVVSLASLALASLAAGLISCGGGKEGAGEVRAAKVTVADRDDVSSLEAWARAICKGTTVEYLASMYGIEPTIEAVSARVGRLLPREASEAVARVCREELLKSANSEEPL
jgi:hypothetical protein